MVGYTALSSNKPWDINQQTKCQVIQLTVTNSPGGQSKKKQVSTVSTHKNKCLTTTIRGSSATMFCLLLHHHPKSSEKGYLQNPMENIISFSIEIASQLIFGQRRRHPKGKRLCFRKA